MKRFNLISVSARQNAISAVRDADEGMCVEIKERRRTVDQNAAQWPILDAFARQLQWPVNGVIRHMTSEEWKDVLTAAFKEEKIQLAQAINGGVVMLGQRTSKFKKKEFSEWLEFLHYVAADKGVNIRHNEAA